MLTKYIIASAILSANLLFANPIFQDEVWPEFENAKTEFERVKRSDYEDYFDPNLFNEDKPATKNKLYGPPGYGQAGSGVILGLQHLKKILDTSNNSLPQ